MLKRKIGQAAFDELPEHLQNLYTQDGDNYVLQFEDDEDKDGEDIREELERLRTKHRIERDHRINAEKERDRLRREEQEREKERQKDQEETSRKAGDVEALDKSWQEKFTAREKELQDETQKYKDAMQTLLVENVAQGIANKISNSPDLLLPFISKRLAVEFEGDIPKTRVLDEDGNISALTAEDLEKQIAGDKRFAQIIIAGKGSGGGGHGNQGSGGAPSKEPSEMTDDELAEWHKRDPEGFRKANQSTF